MINNINQKFSRLNPFTIFIYYVLLFVFLFQRKSLIETIFAFLLISLSVFCYVTLDTIKNSIFVLVVLFSLPLVFNFLFIHDFQSAIKSSFFVCTFFLVFCTFNIFIDDNKIFHIFYKFLPNTALVLSISIRYNYLIIKKYNETIECYKANNDKTTLRGIGDIFISLTNQVLEDSINLAKSIKSKSYQNKKRTYYSTYTFTIKDVFILLIIFFIFYNGDYKYLLIVLPIIYDIFFNAWRILRCQF